MSLDLNDLRNEINRIDDELVKLFLARMQVSKQVAAYKREHGMPIFQPEREAQILASVAQRAPEGYQSAMRDLFGEIMDVSKDLQKEQIPCDPDFLAQMQHALKTPPPYKEHMVIACQGEPGAYSHAAAEQVFGAITPRFYAQFDDVFLAVQNGQADYGVLPVENSLAGSVVNVYDLMRKYDFHIVRTTRLPIRHCLLARKGVRLELIQKVYSHTQGLHQCSEYLAAHRAFTPCEERNTAVAAKMVSESKEPIAAIASATCAKLYGLEILDDHIQNDEKNFTRFMVISQGFYISPDANKISISLRLPHTVGSLYKLLRAFAARGLNMTKIESRPIPGLAFEFLFYLDFEGNLFDPAVLDFIGHLKREYADFQLLGNYPEH